MKDDQRKFLIPYMGREYMLNINCIQDYWRYCARTVEEALVDVVAIADKDYSYIDLFQLSQPFVLLAVKNGTYKVEAYPDKHKIELELEKHL